MPSSSSSSQFANSHFTRSRNRTDFSQLLLTLIVDKLVTKNHYDSERQRRSSSPSINTNTNNTNDDQQQQQQHQSSSFLFSATKHALFDHARQLLEQDPPEYRLSFGSIFDTFEGAFTDLISDGDVVKVKDIVEVDSELASKGGFSGGGGGVTADPTLDVLHLLEPPNKNDEQNSSLTTNNNSRENGINNNNNNSSNILEEFTINPHRAFFDVHMYPFAASTPPPVDGVKLAVKEDCARLISPKIRSSLFILNRPEEVLLFFSRVRNRVMTSVDAEKKKISRYNNNSFDRETKKLVTFAADARRILGASHARTPVVATRKFYIALKINFKWKLGDSDLGNILLEEAYQRGLLFRFCVEFENTMTGKMIPMSKMAPSVEDAIKFVRSTPLPDTEKRKTIDIIKQNYADLKIQNRKNSATGGETNIIYNIDNNGKHKPISNSGREGDKNDRPQDENDTHSNTNSSSLMKILLSDVGKVYLKYMKEIYTPLGLMQNGMFSLVEKKYSWPESMQQVALDELVKKKKVTLVRDEDSEEEVIYLASTEDKRDAEEQQQKLSSELKFVVKGNRDNKNNRSSTSSVSNNIEGGANNPSSSSASPSHRSSQLPIRHHETHRRGRSPPTTISNGTNNNNNHSQGEATRSTSSTTTSASTASIMFHEPPRVTSTTASSMPMYVPTVVANSTSAGTVGGSGHNQHGHGHNRQVNIATRKPLWLLFPPPLRVVNGIRLERSPLHLDHSIRAPPPVIPQQRR